MNKLIKLNKLIKKKNKKIRELKPKAREKKTMQEIIV